MPKSGTHDESAYKPFWLTPEIIRPYDVRRQPLPPPAVSPFVGEQYALCMNGAWWAHVLGLLQRLRYRDAWLGSDEEIDTALVNVERIEAALRLCEGDGCVDYLPSAEFIEYTPNDPFKTPNLVPTNYTLPPWFTNPAITLDDILPTDALVNSGSTIFTNLIATLQIIFGDPGLPRARIPVDGKADVEIEFVQALQGGLALIVMDEVWDDVKIVDLTAQSVLDVDNLLLFLAGISFDAVNSASYKCSIPEGFHTIDIYFVPKISTDVFLGWGGGLRRVTICRSKSMFKLRQNPTNKCLLEQSNDGGVTWLDAFDYSICKQPTKIYRYTTVSHTTVYQESSDGGQTWQDAAPEVDPRHVGSTTPSGNKCKAADGVVKVIQQEVQTIITSANEQGATVISIIKAVLDFLKFFGGQWLEAWLIPLIQSILDGGVQSFSDAFTQQVWDALLCAALEADSNGVYSVDAWNQVKTNISNDLPSGLAKDHIWRVVDMMGAAGLTNAGGMGSAAAECDCGEWECVYDLTTGLHGWTLQPLSQAENGGAVAGTWQSGVGIISTDYEYASAQGFWHENLMLRTPSLVGATLTSAEIVYATSTETQYSGLVMSGPGWDGTWYQQVSGTITRQMNEQVPVADWYFSNPNGYSGGPPSQTYMTITSITLRGTGTPPC